MHMISGLFLISLLFYCIHCNDCRNFFFIRNNLEIHFNRSSVTCIICEVVRGSPMNIVFELFG